jgi:hypothetical protein
LSADDREHPGRLLAFHWPKPRMQHRDGSLDVPARSALPSIDRPVRTFLGIRTVHVSAADDLQESSKYLRSANIRHLRETHLRDLISLMRPVIEKVQRAFTVVEPRGPRPPLIVSLRLHRADDAPTYSCC